MQNEQHSVDRPLDEDNDGDDADSQLVAVRMVNYDETIPQFANDVFVAADPMGLQLVFSQYLPPPVVSPADEAHLRTQGYLPNSVVARIFLPPLLVERLLAALPERLERHREMAAEYAAWLREQLAATEEDSGHGEEA